MGISTARPPARSASDWRVVSVCCSKSMFRGPCSSSKELPSAVLIFVNVPSFEVLEARLRDRATDSEETILRWLANARWELDQVHRYDVQLMNRDLDQAVNDLVALLVQHGCGG